MKVYFPTSTLNFSSIISAQRILPVQYYVEGALWWNRYVKTVAEKDAVTILYNRFPVWEINDPDRDNYPLVIAFDACPVAKKSRIELNCGIGGQKLTAFFTNVPVEVKAKDILAGKIEFFFRNEEEKRRILLKTESGVDECKTLGMLMTARPQAFITRIARTIKNEVRLPVDEAFHLQFEEAERKVLENKLIVEDLIREERLRGAELGFELGGYIRSLRSGVFSGAFRERMKFCDWRDDVLPPSFNSILEGFIDRPAVAWDPNRSSILSLVDKIMADFAKDKSVDKSVKNTFLVLHNHWGSAEQRFKISEIEDVYLQAFAAFLECGTMPGKYPRYLKSVKLKSPEFMLALYGAIVGYTSFSRSLMVNENYLPPPVVEPSVVVAKSVSGASSPGLAMTGDSKATVLSSSQVKTPSRSDISIVRENAEERKEEALKEKKPEQGDLFAEMTSGADGQKLPAAATPPIVGPIEDGGWIDACAAIIDDLKARKTFINDMTWFVGNHKATYVDKDGITKKGRYYGTEYRVTLESIKYHIFCSLNNGPESVRIDYQKVPIPKVMEILSQHYGQ